MTNISLAFPVVTGDNFPHGLACMFCHRPIDTGQPYASHVQSMDEDGETIDYLTCAYCTPKEGT